MVVLAEIQTSLLSIVIAVAGVHLTLGLAAGWWFRGYRSNASHVPVIAPAKQPMISSLTVGPLSAAVVPKSYIAENSAPAAILDYRNQSQPIEPRQEMTRTDPLTGLRNRQAFAEDLRGHVAEWQRFNISTSLMLIEIDGLRRITQVLGPEVGDTLLRAATQFLTTAMHEMDLVARYEGTQFALILPGSDLANAVQAAERIRNAVAFCKLPLDGRELQFTISAGIAEAMPGDDMDILLNRTVAALDASSDAGGNCTFFHNGLVAQHASSLLLESAAAAP